MNFSDWVMQLEVFDTDSIKNHKPKDGKWYPSLSSDEEYYRYYFNVPGDDCDSVDPCYYVSISNGDLGASIAFARDGSYDDSGVGMPQEVFKSVLKALSEFIDAKNPVGLSWTPAQKSKVNPVTGRITNPEARKHLYEKWAFRSLFPDRYVPLSNNSWVRRDVYEDTYVAQQGYPPVPQDVTADSSPAQKKIAYNKLAEERKNSQEKIRQRRYEEAERRRQEAEERQRREEEEQRRQREEALQSHLQNPEVNPYNLKIGDIVDLSGVSTHRDYQNRVGKIYDFHLRHDNQMLANVAVFYEGDESAVRTYEYFKLSELQPETEETKAARQERIRRAEELRRQEEERLEREREEQLQTAINDPTKNPDGLKPGDNVITYLPQNPNSNQNGLIGVLNRFELSGGELMAYVDWDDSAIEVVGHYRRGRPVNAQFLRKNTPDVAERIAAERRRREQEEIIARQREREEEERQEQEALQQNAAETIALANDTENNPQGFKVGDHVVITGGWPHRNRGKRGYIYSMHRYYWGNIQAVVKFYNRYAPIEVRLHDLARDESEETQRRQQRRQQRSQRTATIQQAAQAGGFQIGDIVNVTSGLNRNKTGRIVQFQSGTQGNVRAVMMNIQDNSRFTANIRALQRVETEPIAQAS